MINKYLFPSAVVVVSMVSSCALISPERAIRGRWTEVGASNSHMEFFADGTISGASYGISYSGDYEFLDRETVKINVGGAIGAFAGPLVLKISIEGDEMTMSNASGNVTSYRKQN
ncbi:MAG: hypothetical protein ACXITR_09665 [Cyanobacterium sp.]